MQQYTIKDGILTQATFIASPNFNQRPLASGQPDVSGIVIHNISLPPSQFGQCTQDGEHYVEAFFQNKLNKDDHPYFQTIYQMAVSAHLFIKRNGDITQFVNFNDRAWHAGKSGYLGRSNCNDFTIGIELEGDDDTAYTPAQYQALSGVVVAIYQAYPKTCRHLMGHSDIAPIRKTDPGKAFDWCLFRHMIQSMMPKPSNPNDSQTTAHPSPNSPS